MTTNRRLAREQGLPTYQSDRPCLRGHDSPRRTCSGVCIECDRAWRSKPVNVQRNRDRVREWQHHNRDKVRHNLQQYRRRHPDRCAEYKARVAERYREYYRDRARLYRAENPLIRREMQARRKARVAAATPAWLDRSQLRQVYLGCPDGLTVDHIVPLNGKNVSGLHVPWNLQYLTLSDNSKKRNKFDAGIQGRAQ